MVDPLFSEQNSKNKTLDLTGFHYVEKVLSKRKRGLKDASLEEMDRIWEEAKALESLKPDKE